MWRSRPNVGKPPSADASDTRSALAGSVIGIQGGEAKASAAEEAAEPVSNKNSSAHQQSPNLLQAQTSIGAEAFARSVVGLSA
mmetsp:Transcript_69395/g.133879  ORF Transcript_69395/g.133879 Transcript_69395/m.133879 type:complete len:83 (+) Transcript_69395:130-378(+)